MAEVAKHKAEVTQNTRRSEELSKLLSRHLHLTGVSKTQLCILRSLTKLLEAVGEKCGQFYRSCGGLVEGTMLSGSDTDQFVMRRDAFAVWNSNYIAEKKERDPPFTFSVEPCESPGFSRLKLIEDESSKRNLRKSVYSLCLVQKGNGMYLSSRELLNNTYLSASGKPTKWMNHGPAKSTLVFNALSDFVMGIECESWPVEAMEWIRRPRKNCWPNAAFVEALRKNSCYLVPVGDPSSGTSSLEWRYAFVGLERELIWSFNDTQIHSLLILKTLRSEHLEPIAPDHISTYVIKTIIFWESERSGLGYWREDNLIHCVDKCLGKLEECIKMRDLPHYIFREGNLLKNKLADQTIRMQLIQAIEDIRNNICFYISTSEKLNLRHCRDEQNGVDGNKWKWWKGVSENWSSFLKQYRHELSQVKPKLTKMRQVSFGLNTIRMGPATVSLDSVNIILDTLAAIEKDKDHAQQAKDAIQMFFNTAIGYCCLENRNTGNFKRISMDCFLNNDRYFASNRLHLATYYYVCGEKKNSFAIVRDFCLKWQELTYTGCFAEKHDHSIPTQTGLRQYVDNEQEGQLQQEALIEDLTYEKSAFDLYFSEKCASNGLPDALQFECTLRRMYSVTACSLHPIIYAYYLLFQLYHDHQNTNGEKSALRMLQKNVQKLRTVPEHHSYIAMNMLGFCLYKHGDLKNAAKQFLRSITIHGEKYNAAYYHLCILLVNGSVSKCQSSLIHNTTE